MKLLGLSKDVVQQSWEDATRSRDHHHHRRRQAEQQPAPLQRQGTWQGPCHSWRGTAVEYTNKPAVRAPQ